MNYKQRTDILQVLSISRSEVFFNSDSEWRTSKLAKLDGLIEVFKEDTVETLNELPESLAPHDDNGDLFPVDEWVSEDMRGMAFIPSDGCGHWATEDGFSYDHSDVFGAVPSWATHVVWCNK